MNFKRKRPKSGRAGCLLCKPWKIMGNSKNAKKKQDLVNRERALDETVS